MSSRVPLLMLACLFSLLQIGFAASQQKPEGWYAKWLALNSIESREYLTLATDGYHANLPPAHSGVTQWPLLPILIRCLSALTGASAPVSLLLLTALGTWLFWFALLSILERYHVPFWVQSVTLAATFCFPGSFHLVSGGAESWWSGLILMGFYLWVVGIGRRSMLPAICFCLAALIHPRSLPYGLLLWANWVAYHRDTRDWRERWRGLLPVLKVQAAVAAVVCCFFLYCHFTFGHWNAYHLARPEGFRFNLWNLVAPFDFSHWRFPLGESGASLTALLALLLLAALAIELFSSSTRLFKNSQRLGLALGNGLAFYLLLAAAAGSTAPLGQGSGPTIAIVRYTILTYTLWFIWFSLLCRDLLYRGFERRQFRWATLAIAVMAFGLSLHLLRWQAWEIVATSKAAATTPTTN